jgi:hypothetical protein
MLALALSIAGAGTGCNNGGDDSTDFVVDNPGGGGDGGLTGGDSGDPSGDDEGGGDDGGREISEADIVFVEGDRVYALSAYGGLAVVDAANPGQALPVLGRHRMHAQPFEMYVDSGQVFVMTNAYGSYDYDEASGGYVWHSSSRLLALDASNPASIVSRGEFELPGTIQDSRRVGDVLYLVTFEDGWCWGCAENQPRTVITSLDVSNPAQPQQVDQLVFENQTDDAWDWAGPRSVSSTDERMYIGGIEYDDWESAHSVIDVVDISDPGGVLVRGASVEIAGSIESRWQMDEHEGALRVISQAWGWSSDAPPVIETFSVASASEVVPLASVPMVLPRPETLQSVRFDGPRAYAITFEQTDPLFAIDLADPSAPQQRGELEIPGWVYHMEPRGDRLLALGFDRDHPEGSIHVSLFDVADLDQPTLLSRVAFGGDWASFAEDQNRIHKAFTILDELDLVLVPFSGWAFSDVEGEAAEWSCGVYQSGTQLVDWSDDALVRRGVAPSHGQSRRALVHRDRLLTVSDKSMQAFDITDRDAPALSAQVALASNVSTVAAEGDLVVRLAQDWWSNETAIEVVSAADAEAAEPLGRLVLAEVSDEFECNRSWPVDLFVRGGYAYLVRETYDLTTYEPRLVLDTISVHEPVAPAWLGSTDLPFSRGWGGYYYGFGSQGQERAVVLHDDALVFTTNEPIYSGDDYLGTEARLEVVDLSAPDAPMHAGTLERPQGLSHGELQVQDGTLVSWHMREVDGDASKVRFYFDRFDVSSPAAPQASPSVNVPGQVVAYDGGEQRVVVVGFELETVALTGEECWMHPQQWGWSYDGGSCTLAHRPLHLLSLSGGSASLLDTLDVEGEEGRLANVVSSGDRVFALVSEGGYYGWGAVDDEGGGVGTVELPTDQLAIVTGQRGNALEEAARVTLSEGGAWSWMAGAAGAHALIISHRGLGFVDATEAAEPRVTVVPTYGWGCYQPRVAGEVVYCPMHEYGLQAVAIP